MRVIVSRAIIALFAGLNEARSAGAGDGALVSCSRRGGDEIDTCGSDRLCFVARDAGGEISKPRA